MKAVVILLVILLACVWVVWASNPNHPERLGLRHVVRIDGCQYIEQGWPGTRGYILTHKGDCDNPIHKK